MTGHLDPLDTQIHGTSLGELTWGCAQQMPPASLTTPLLGFQSYKNCPHPPLLTLRVP